MRRAIFTLRMKRFLLVFSILLTLLSSCKSSPKPYLYKDAERDFIASLTLEDTLTVLSMGQSFMDSLKCGDVDEAVESLCVVDQSVLYKIADRSLNQIKARFRRFPVADYELTSYSFSTQGINDLVYRYSLSGPMGDGPAMKLTLNPVKVEGMWFLTLKDAYMSSKGLAPEDQVSPYAYAPDTLRLNRAPKN